MKLFTSAILATVILAQDEDNFENYDSSLNDPEGLDEEHKKGDIQYIHIDQGWVDFAARTDTIFRSLFPEVVNDPDFIANIAEQKREDNELCTAGYDPFGRRMRCRQTDETTGFRLIKSEYMPNSRKQAQLKIMTFWLSNNRQFGKYCNYGCHCLANLSERGYGQPVDDVDKTCKALNQCYECAKLGSDTLAPDAQCDGASQKYKYRLYKNTVSGDQWITCLPSDDPCSKRICECDLRYAQSLAEHESKWNVQFHTERNDGSWKYNEQCHRNKGAYGKPESCCGSQFPDVIPKQTGKECCGYRPFDPAGPRKCCSENKLRESC